jgi:hypothetical protein
MSDRSSKIAENTKEMTIVNRGGSRDKLTHRIKYIWARDNKIYKAPNKITMARRIRERITIRSAKREAGH